MNFEEASREYRKWRGLPDRGRRIPTAFEQAVGDMQVTDAGGRVRQIGVMSGSPRRREGAQWIETTPSASFSVAPAETSSPSSAPVVSAPARKSKTWIWIGCGVAVLALGVCGILVLTLGLMGTSTSTSNRVVSPPEPTERAAAPEVGQTALPGVGPGSAFLLQDEFSDPASGWPARGYEGNVMEYASGGYRMYVSTADRDIIADHQSTFPADVWIEVDISKIGGPDKNSFGVICRMEDLQNFYLFEITSDGLGAIGKFENDQKVTLSGEFFEPIHEVNQGNATNRIRAECEGSSLRLAVNGSPTLEVVDTTFAAAGRIGFIAGAADTAGTEVLYDNLVVLQP